MPKLADFDRYIFKGLCEVLGHQDRHAGFADCRTGADVCPSNARVWNRWRLTLIRCM